MIIIKIKSKPQGCGRILIQSFFTEENLVQLLSILNVKGRMKPFNKRLNKRKASKVTLKTHRKNNHPPLHDEIKEATNGVTSVRPEDVKIHQHY